MSKSLLGVERQNLRNLHLKPLSHVRILIYMYQMLTVDCIQNMVIKCWLD